MKISIDRSRCVGSGNCVMAAAEFFDQSEEDGRVVLVAQPATQADEDRVRFAAEACPTNAIQLED